MSSHAIFLIYPGLAKNTSLPVSTNLHLEATYCYLHRDNVVSILYFCIFTSSLMLKWMTLDLASTTFLYHAQLIMHIVHLRRCPASDGENKGTRGVGRGGCNSIKPLKGLIGFFKSTLSLCSTCDDRYASLLHIKM